MKVVQMDRFGGPEVLQVQERPTPEPGPGEILVRVHAAGVNLSDTLMRQNRYAMTPDLPSVLGNEVTGVVARVGPGSGGLSPGTRIAAPLFAAGAHVGGYAEYVLIDARLATPLPDGLSFAEGTALMVQGLTALYLTRQAPPRGKRVLVSAAAGGVGSLLVQLARHAGAASVIAAASSPAKLEFAQTLGADHGVDYTQPGWVERVRELTGGQGADLIYESVGGSVTMDSLRALAPSGELVIYGALNIQQFQLGIPELLPLIFRNQSVKGFAVAPLLTAERLREDLPTLFSLAVEGKLRVTVGGTFPFEQAGDAHRAIESRSTRGKIVLVA